MTKCIITKRLYLHWCGVLGVRGCNAVTTADSPPCAGGITQEGTFKFPPQYVTEIERNFARNHERQMAQKVIDARRKLPPVLNETSLFTRAASFPERGDIFYHSPSSRISAHYSPSSWLAASALFEEFPSDPNAPRTLARSRRGPGPIADVTSPRRTASNSPLKV